MPFKYIFGHDFELVWQHLSSRKSMWPPVLSPCLLRLSPSSWISLLVDSLVNMRLDSYDLYVLPLYPAGLLVNRPVFPLPWRLMWHAAKHYTGVNHGRALRSFSCKQGCMPLNYIELLLHIRFNACNSLLYSVRKSWMMTIKWYSNVYSLLLLLLKCFKMHRWDQGLWANMLNNWGSSRTYWEIHQFDLLHEFNEKITTLCPLNIKPQPAAS